MHVFEFCKLLQTQKKNTFISLYIFLFMFLFTKKGMIRANLINIQMPYLEGYNVSLIE